MAGLARIPCPQGALGGPSPTILALASSNLLFPLSRVSPISTVTCGFMHFCKLPDVILKRQKEQHCLSSGTSWVACPPEGEAQVGWECPAPRPWMGAAACTNGYPGACELLPPPPLPAPRGRQDAAATAPEVHALSSRVTGELCLRDVGQADVDGALSAFCLFFPEKVQTRTFWARSTNHHVAGRDASCAFSHFHLF